MGRNIRRPLPVVILCWALCLMCIAFIFSMSSQKAEDSERSSGNTIRAILRIFVRDFDGLPEAEQAEMIESWQHVVRKGAHFSVYLLLGALFCQALFGHTENSYILICGAILFSMLFAATDELHQIFVPGRSGELRDVAIDSGGATLGTLISFGLTRLVLYSKRSKKRVIPKKGNKSI